MARKESDKPTVRKKRAKSVRKKKVVKSAGGMIPEPSLPEIPPFEMRPVIPITEKGVWPCLFRLNPYDLCVFLHRLDEWLQEFNADYTALREAMCNVERQAFFGDGVVENRFGPCRGGGSGDPPSDPPPDPPTWD